LKDLNDILKQINGLRIIGTHNRKISGIEFDSRKAKPGNLFVAQKGSSSDGHRFIPQLIEKGIKVIACEQLPENADIDTTWIVCDDTHNLLGLLASAYYNHPSKELKLVGVSGTNGKTTIASLLHQLFMTLGYKTGLFSTVENKINHQILKSTHTTPDAVQINSLLSKMLDAGCDYCFMEVSSHAIDQKRIAGLHFNGGIFTNITHDHLDYHGSFLNYIHAKKAFFDDLPKTAFAITNLDDKNGTTMLQNTKARKRSYSLTQMADYKCRILENSLEGLHLDLNGQQIWSLLSGKFNAYNIAAIYAAAIECGQKQTEVLESISSLHAAEGRMELIRNTGSVTGIIDYAHTPDALKNVLETLQEIKSDKGQIICVAGAGGDRDRSKRPEMGNIAASLSDRFIITSDNPRSENPEDIIKDIEKGLTTNSQRQKTLSITNRKEAIRTAVQLAGDGDIVLVAGKGHEKYQEINKIKHSFDDKEILLSELKTSQK